MIFEGREEEIDETRIRGGVRVGLLEEARREKKAQCAIAICEGEWKLWWGWFKISALNRFLPWLLAAEARECSRSCLRSVSKYHHKIFSGTADEDVLFWPNYPYGSF